MEKVWGIVRIHGIPCDPKLLGYQKVTVFKVDFTVLKDQEFTEQQLIPISPNPLHLETSTHTELSDITLQRHASK